MSEAQSNPTDNLPDFPDDPLIFNTSNRQFPQTTWVLGFDGVVHRVAKTNNHCRHPFSGIPGVPDARNYDLRQMGIPLTGWAVLRCSGHPVERGHFYDEKGNVTPNVGRSKPLKPGESAYHEGKHP